MYNISINLCFNITNSPNSSNRKYKDVLDSLGDKRDRLNGRLSFPNSSNR